MFVLNDAGQNMMKEVVSIGRTAFEKKKKQTRRSKHGKIVDVLFEAWRNTVAYSDAV